MNTYYCVRKMRDPDTNPGYIPCPDYELHGCVGCKELENKEGKMAKKTEPKASDTVYMMVNTRDRSKAGVISHAVNCGYSDEQLKNMAKFGWKVKEGKV